MKQLPPPKKHVNNVKLTIILLVFGLAVLKVADISNNVYEGIVSIGVRRAEDRARLNARHKVDTQVKVNTIKALERGRMSLPKLLLAKFQETIY
jgi:hypothetical protein